MYEVVGVISSVVVMYSDTVEYSVECSVFTSVKYKEVVSTCSRTQRHQFCKPDFLHKRDLVTVSNGSADSVINSIHELWSSL